MSLSDARTAVAPKSFVACESASERAPREPVDFLFVLDHSGSMVQAGKWDALSAALESVVHDFHDAQDASVGVGLILFPGYTNAGPYPGSSDVFVNYVDDATLTALDTRLSISPIGTTPTRQALTGAYGELSNLIVLPPLTGAAKKVLVLATDGQPDDAQFDYADLVARAHDDAIETFVIGIGDVDDPETEVNPAFLGPLAVAGGTARPGCDPTETSDTNLMCHDQIQPGNKAVSELTQNFVDAFNRIRATANACELSLAPTQKNSDATRIDVSLVKGDGTKSVVPNDAMNGFTFDEVTKPTKIFLHGSACESAVTDYASHVEIDFACKTITN